MENKNLNQQDFVNMIVNAFEKEYKEKVKDTDLPKRAAKKYSEYKTKARDLLQNHDELENFLFGVEKKLKKIPKAGDKLAPIPQMILLVRSYAIGDYRDVTKTEIVIVLAGLLYFLFPIDVIPDKIPLAGIVDDALVIGAVSKYSKNTLKDYMKWLERKKKFEKATDPTK